MANKLKEMGINSVDLFSRYMFREHDCPGNCAAEGKKIFALCQSAGNKRPEEGGALMLFHQRRTRKIHEFFILGLGIHVAIPSGISYNN